MRCTIGQMDDDAPRSIEQQAGSAHCFVVRVSGQDHQQWFLRKFLRRQTGELMQRVR
jgi:hypothetical protein